MSWPGVGKGFNAAPRLHWCGKGCNLIITNTNIHRKRGLRDKMNPQRCAMMCTLPDHNTDKYMTVQEVRCFFRENNCLKIVLSALKLFLSILHTLMKEGIE